MYNNANSQTEHVGLILNQWRVGRQVKLGNLCCNIWRVRKSYVGIPILCRPKGWAVMCMFKRQYLQFRGGGGSFFFFFFCLHSVCLHINTNVLSYVCSWAYVSKVLMLEKHWQVIKTLSQYTWRALPPTSIQRNNFECQKNVYVRRLG